MTTDLTTVRDHPAAVLRAAADQAVSMIPPLPEEKAEAAALHVAAATLNSYERGHGVTFAALDNDALAEVRQAYEDMVDADRYSLDAQRSKAKALTVAVDALLGLES